MRTHFITWLGLAGLLAACEPPIRYHSEKQITAFRITSLRPDVVGVIDEQAKTIHLVIPARSKINNLKPTLEISPYATVEPASGTAQDFSQPVWYTVTAEDGSQQTYRVTVSRN